MIVGMRTRRQAARVAALTGGAQLPGKPKRDGTPQVSRYVDVGADFETHRSAVESVSVLFDLYDGDLEGYAATGRPGQQVPSGWMVTAAKFEVEWPTDPKRSRLIRSHFGARRKAFNWGLAQVKADLDARKSDPAHGCGSPPGRCDSSPIGAPSPCRSSVAYGPRRTLAGCSVTSPLAVRAS
jgi:putative transposase